MCDTVRSLTLYRSPGCTQEDNNIMTQICDCIKSCCGNNLITVVNGDLNCSDIDWLNYNASVDVNQILFFNTVSDLGFYQFVDSPTRGDNILDIVLCNDPLLISDVSVCQPFSTSDHASIKFVINASECISVCSEISPNSFTIPGGKSDPVQSKLSVNSKTN